MNVAEVAYYYFDDSAANCLKGVELTHEAWTRKQARETPKAVLVLSVGTGQRSLYSPLYAFTGYTSDSRHDENASGKYRILCIILCVSIHGLMSTA